MSKVNNTNVVVGMLTPVEKIGQDLSDPIVKIYQEVPPYAVDPETGEFINKSSRPKIVEVGQKNIDEEIQSYKDSVDTYKILEKFALTGDNSIINRRVGEFGDIVDIPDNINDFGQYVDSKIKELKQTNPELAKQIINDNVSAEDIQKMVQEQVQAALIKAQEQQAAAVKETE